MESTIFELIETAYYSANNTYHDIKTIEDYENSSEKIERIDKITSSLKAIGFDYEVDDDDFMFFMGEKIEDISEKAKDICIGILTTETVKFFKRKNLSFLGGFELEEGESVDELQIEVEHGREIATLVYSASNSSSFCVDAHGDSSYGDYDHKISADLEYVLDPTGFKLEMNNFTADDWEFLTELGKQKCM